MISRLYIINLIHSTCSFFYNMYLNNGKLKNGSLQLPVLILGQIETLIRGIGLLLQQQENCCYNYGGICEYVISDSLEGGVEIITYIIM